MTSAAGTEQSGQRRRSGLEYGLPLQVSNIFTLAGDDIRLQVVSCDAAEGGTTGEMGTLGRDMGLVETLEMGWLTKHHKDYSKHISTYNLLGICLKCHFLPMKSQEAHKSLSSDDS